MAFIRDARADDVPRLPRIFDPTRPAWVRELQADFEALWAGASVFGAAIEDEHGELFGVSFVGFLTPEFSHHILTMPDPVANSAAREFLLSGRAVTLPDLDRDPGPYMSEAAAEGAHLHLFELHWAGPLLSPKTAAMRARLAQATLDRFVGARLRLITFEARGEGADALASAGFRPLNPYPGHGKVPPEIMLMGADRSSMDVSQNVWLMEAFGPTSPRLPLSPRQRRILYHARLGRSDPEIADRVFISPNSMKTTWDRIYQGFSQVASVAASPEKRKAVLGYLTAHPEEMWPIGK